MEFDWVGRVARTLDGLVHSDVFTHVLQPLIVTRCERCGVQVKAGTLYTFSCLHYVRDVFSKVVEPIGQFWATEVKWKYKMVCVDCVVIEHAIHDTLPRDEIRKRGSLWESWGW